MSTSTTTSCDQLQTKAIQITENIQYGTSLDNNYREYGNTVQVGSAYTQGQNVRSLTSINTTGVSYTSTSFDNSNILNTYTSIFQLYPNLINYPYLSSIQELLPESNLPIYRCPGKGQGESEFYNCAASTNGNYRTTQESAFYYSNIFNGNITIPEPLNDRDGPRFPFSGLLYSGNLVQLRVSDGNVQVLLYQSGRGIQQYDPFQEYFAGDAYGIPKDPESGLIITPELSMGSIPGNNDCCLGVCISTNYKDNEKLYKYPKPNKELYNTIDLNVWCPVDSHPAPFTVAAKNISISRTQRTYSPENSSNSYFAPWPDYYAFQENQAVPVLSSGPVCTRIGAATNIGTQAYYEPDVLEGDDPRNNPNYVAVSIVPLFQGEQVNVGSYVYANCLGHVITPEPVGTTPYPVASYDDASGNIFGTGTVFFTPFEYIRRDARSDNPWYDWFDVTYGTTGFTGTPTFLLSGIPDVGHSVIESRNNVDLPYMVQSNQGSLIVSASTTTNPMDSGGSGRMNLLSCPQYQDSTNNLSFKRLTKFSGMIERSLCVGNTLHAIEGTGQWTYTGSMIGYDQETFVNGFGYTLNSVVDATSFSTSSSGVTYNILGDNSITLNTAGIDTTLGELLVLQRSFTNSFGRGTLSTYGSSRLVEYETTEQYGGSGYMSSSYVETINISRNNLYVLATATNNTTAGFNVNFILISQITSVSVFEVSDVSRYPVGTIVQIMNDANPANWARVQVTGNNGTVLTLSLINGGGRNTYDLGTYIYSTKILYSLNPTVSITTDNGIVNTIKSLSIPERNRENDQILIYQPGSDYNAIFTLEKNINKILNYNFILLKGGVYYFKNPNYYTDALMFGNFTELQPNIATIYQNSTSTGASILIGNTTVLGQVTQASYLPNNPTFTGTFGAISTIQQLYPISLATQPTAGAEPADGWQSYVVRNTATYIQDLRFYAMNRGGTQYTPGIYSTFSGSGTGMTVKVSQTNPSTGAIEDIEVSDYGTGYLMGDKIIVNGTLGTSAIYKLKLPVSKELDLFYQKNVNIDPVLLFDPYIQDPGTGYSVGVVNTRCIPYDENVIVLIGQPFISGFSMQFRILEVSADGEIEDIEIVLPVNNPATNAMWCYQVGYRITIPNAGDGNAIIELRRPLKPPKMIFTSGGSSYTDGTNVSTYNLTQNNLVTLCGMETTGIGQCQVISYNTTFPTPTFWDLSRYQVGDVLAFDQLGNQSATAQIIFLDIATSRISFLQLTVGTGYIAPALSTPYAFLPTVNLSRTNTTVSIETTSGTITKITSIDQLGTGAQVSDQLVILGGDENALFQLGPQKDVPASWQIFKNGRDATASEWNEYKQVLKSSVNLLEQPIVYNFAKMYPQYYDNSWYYYGNPDNKDPYSAGFSIWTNNL
jgi:hypothetical protein